ncbi:MAG: TonB-dependent receptor [Gammaproteobacteria bacterium]|nr:TonB-dependent receptor [Gammaproteobacteria bacterium]
MSIRRATSTAAFCCSICAALATLAQADVPDQGAGPVENGSGQLAEIVVTAQKRAESIQNVGITIAAFAADELKAHGVTEAIELAAITPAVNLAGSYGGQSLTFAIRGVTQQDFSGHTESPTAVYIDDGYLAYNNAADVGLFDIERVEVLKGPQGTLFGRNATGGLVNIISKKPAREPEGYITAGYGSYHAARMEGAVGGSISDNLMFRIAAQGEHNDAYVRNINAEGEDLGSKSRFAFRGHLLYDSGGDLNVLLTAYSSRADFSWSPYFSVSTRNVTDASGRIVDSIIVNQPTLIGTIPTPEGSLTVNANDARGNGGFSELTGGTAKVTWGHEVEVTSVTDYKHARTRLAFDGEASEISFLNDLTKTSVDNFSQEFRLFRSSGPLRYYAGAYFLNILSSVQDNVVIPPLGAYLQQTYGLRTNSYSVFSQAEYDVFPAVTAIAGARAAYETKTFHYQSLLYSPTATGGQGTFIAPARSPFSGSSSDTLVTAKAQLQYHPNRDILLYAGWNRGSKAGNFNAPYAGSAAYPNSGIPYKPEVLNAYEVGFKTDLVARTLRINGDTFYYDYSDYQSFTFIGLSNQVTNHKAKIFGGEITLEVTPTRGLTLKAAGSYTNGRVYDVGVGPVLFSSRKIPFSSEWQANAAAAYEFPVAGGHLSLQGDVSYLSSYYYSDTNFSSTLVNGRALTGAMLAWASASDAWRVAIRVSNLTDERYKTVGFDISNLCGCSQVGYGEPRWVSAAITHNF